MLGIMAKHLVDLDEDLLSAAPAELGTKTIEDTVAEAFRRPTRSRERQVHDALDVLARGPKLTRGRVALTPLIDTSVLAGGTRS